MGDHYAKIAGTGRKIIGGKTMVGGTVYDIVGGKTKIGGTVYDISFNAPAPATDLDSLMQAMQVEEIAGIDASEAGNVSMDISSYLTGDYYILSFCNGYMSVYSLHDGTLDDVKQMSATVGNCCKQGNSIYYSDDGVSASAENGATLVLISTPGMNMADVIDTFKYTIYTTVDGANSSTGENNLVAYAVESAYLIGARSDNIEIYQGCNADDPVLIEGQAFDFSSADYFDMQSVYGGSIIALDYIR